MSSMKELLYQRETAAFMIAERMEEIQQLRTQIEHLRQEVCQMKANLVREQICGRRTQ
jgi:hypothetical protein